MPALWPDTHFSFPGGKKPRPRNKKAVDWVKSQIGTVEHGGDNCGRKIQSWQSKCGYGAGDAWCQIFVNNAFHHVTGRWFTKDGYTVRVFDNHPKNQFQLPHSGKSGKKRTLKPGDWIYFLGGNYPQGHVGMVSSHKNGIIYTVEGNTGKPGGGPDGVFAKQHSDRSSDIRGFLRPPY